MGTKRQPNKIFRQVAVTSNPWLYSGFDLGNLKKNYFISYTIFRFIFSYSLLGVIYFVGLIQASPNRKLSNQASFYQSNLLFKIQSKTICSN